MTERFQLRTASWTQDKRFLKHIRSRVFVIEQDIPDSLEWDAADLDSLHLLAFTQNRDAVGTIRLEPTGKIGRLAVLEEYRGLGLGDRLLNEMIAKAKDAGHKTVFLHAQLQAFAFYERHGFVSEGKKFLEGGIPHVRARLNM